MDNPLAPAWAPIVTPVLQPIAIALAAASLIGGASAAIVRFRRARDVERQQLKWFAYAVGMLLTALLAPLMVGFPRPTEDTLLSGVSLSVGFVAIPVATGLGILRYRLFDIDQLINRTLLYGALTGCVVLIYTFVVGYLGTIFRSGDNPLISLAATGLVAVLFQPLRDRLQRAVNRLTYGLRDEPYGLVAGLDRQLAATVAPDAVLPTLAVAIRDGLRLSSATISVRAADGQEVLAATAGVPGGAPAEVPLTFQGEVVGTLALGPRGPGETLTPRDRRVVEDLARHAGAAVHAVRLTAELQRSRERLVLAREEERRRLRRDLHDELAPTLAGLGLTAASVDRLMPTDPGRAQEVARTLHSAIRSATGQIRHLAHDLRPPALDELGLLDALRERVAHYDIVDHHDDAPRPRVAVELDTALPSLPAAVEVAAYRIVQEALMNVVCMRTRAGAWYGSAAATAIAACTSTSVTMASGCRTHIDQASASAPCASALRSSGGAGASSDSPTAVRTCRPGCRSARAGGTVPEREVEPVGVLIADDHPLFRDGLRLLLESTDDLRVMGEAGSGDEVVAQATEVPAPPDVVVMDLKMPGLSGIEATRRIRATTPQVHVLIVTMFEDDASILAAMRAGARGYVLKDAAREDILRAIRGVARGEAIFSPAIASRVLDAFVGATSVVPREAFPMLTEREREILHALARGCSNGEIAAQLALTPKTVRNYISAVLSKLQVVDRTEAILRAREAGLGRRTNSGG